MRPLREGQYLILIVWCRESMSLLILLLIRSEWSVVAPALQVTDFQIFVSVLALSVPVASLAYPRFLSEGWYQQPEDEEQSQKQVCLAELLLLNPQIAPRPL